MITSARDALIDAEAHFAEAARFLTMKGVATDIEVAHLSMTRKRGLLGRNSPVIEVSASQVTPAWYFNLFLVADTRLGVDGSVWFRQGLSRKPTNAAVEFRSPPGTSYITENGKNAWSFYEPYDFRRAIKLLSEKESLTETVRRTSDGLHIDLEFPGAAIETRSGRTLIEYRGPSLQFVNQTRGALARCVPSMESLYLTGRYDSRSDWASLADLTGHAVGRMAQRR
ncbi:hypothetical protein GIY30_02335 [Gordonia sp. HNM0687]|uniref:Uncharacterized protein n=1 Tax=Gordonia mangrovi TaxID=2665643 RepID=A0A6L7GJV4_9ACTN|nr:hypothetical protein [Gordonia mangrovi]MXP20209.1 hypothetical protein [Gordonia mangrovi]UVF79183.1 hypothetical protein NWF22_04900 [Gordonia mangrovi]